MVKYVFKRIGYMIFVFFILSILFFFLYTSVPGDPAMRDVVKLSGKVTTERFNQLYLQAREKHGLDDPMFIRYAKWMKNILSGDLGYSSFFMKPVSEVIPIPMRNTIFLNVANLILIMGITIPLGIKCAVKKNSVFDRTVQVGTIVGYSTPSFILALVTIFIFAVKLGWFPVSGIGTPGAEYTGMRALLDRLYYLTLPLFVLTISGLGGMTRYVRASMVEALGSDYVRTARAKGLREKVVVYSHAWRNALLPVITLIISWFLGIFGGSIIIENMFGLNGMGKTYIQGLQNQDYDLAMAIQLFYVIISLVGNLLIDLSYGLVDPRVRITK